jgi:hypothetical protein
MIPFQRLIELFNTVELVSNSYWREEYSDAHALVKAMVFGWVEDLTPKGWEMVQTLLEDIESVSPLTIFNPNNLPIITG